MGIPICQRHFPRPSTTASSTSPLRDQCSACRSVRPTANTHTHTHTLYNAYRDWRYTFRADSLTHSSRGKSNKPAARPGSFFLTRVSVFPDLPRAEERRRVSEQHKGVSQGLHIVPRRGECLLRYGFIPCLYHTLSAFYIHEKCFKNRTLKRSHCSSKQWAHGVDGDRGRRSELQAENNHPSPGWERLACPWKCRYICNISTA